METLVPIIVIGVLFFAFGWFMREWFAITNMNKMISHMENASKQEEPNLIRIIIEKVEDNYFVYNAEDNSFMAQGKSKKELEDALKIRYPNVVFACPESNLEEVGFK